MLRAYIGGAGLGAWLMHRARAAGRRPARPRGAARLLLLPARRHAADDEREVRRRGQVAADRPAQRRAGVEPLRHRRQAHRPRRDRRARRVRRALGPARRRRRRRGSSPPATSGGCSAAEPRRGCASGSARPGASPRSARRASGSSSTRPSPTTAATPAAAASARCSARSCIKAVAVRPSTKVAPADPPAVLAAARDLRARSFGPATAKYRELGTLANLLAFNAIATLPTRNFQAATFAEAPRLAAEDLAEARGVARDSCASCSIGCEHIYKGAGGKQARVEYENVFALGPLCGVSDPDAVLEASGRCDELGLDTISDRRDDRLGDGVRRARPDRRAVAALRRRATRCCARSTRSARARASARCWPRARARAARGRRPGLGGVRPARQGPRAARLRAAHAAGDGARARGQRARRRPQPLGRLRGRPVRRARPPRAAARPHVAAAIETEDRAAVMDSLILCKFLRGVFEDPFPEWARAAEHASPAGTSTATSSRRRRGGSCWPSARSTRARAGRAPTTACPSGFLDEPLEVASGRSAALTRERLDAMIERVLRGPRAGRVGGLLRRADRGPPTRGHGATRSIARSQTIAGP